MSIPDSACFVSFSVAMALFASGVVLSLIFGRSAGLVRIGGNLLALGASISTTLLGLCGLAGARFQLQFAGLFPLDGVLLGLDRLSAFFVLIVGIGGGIAAIYAIGYTRGHEGGFRLARMTALLNLFLATMVLVPLARNALTFLFLWELMSLASFLLVMTEAERAETRKAGWIYLVMTHIGFACLVLGFFLLAHGAGSTEFAEWNRLSGGLRQGTQGLVFVLLLAGFGAKAGLIPLHVWLPAAHPAAPSHVSALMSGVMVKLGVYGLIRLGFDWLGAGPSWWGGVVLLAASATAVLGVLYALVESDLKRLLAYSTIENIGIILMSLGAGLLFRTFQIDTLASLALIAALFHSLNHMLFKSLLFMGAGSIIYAAHTRNMEEMGGLLKRMPQTGLFFLIGSVAIAALPPLNGFLSEWLTFQALLQSFQISNGLINLAFALAIAALALTGGAAAACFVKAFGISFLALPRSQNAQSAAEVGLAMRLGMAIPAVSTLVLGVFPGPFLSFLQATGTELTGSSANLLVGLATLSVAQGFSSLSPVFVAVALELILLGLPVFLLLVRTNFQTRLYETWSCGRALQTARFEYTAAAFANPFMRVFSLLYRPVKRLAIQFHPGSRYFVRSLSYRTETRFIFEEILYLPVLKAAGWLARCAQLLQSGNINVYLLYILLALIGLLLVA